jgi:hypothetical protein
MKYRTVQEIKSAMLESGDLWRIPFMEFVDDLRRTHDHRLIQNPFPLISRYYLSKKARSMDMRLWDVAAF